MKLDALIEKIRKLTDTDEPQLPPVDQWHPERTTSIDLSIDRNGDWFYTGKKIERVELIRLFSGILRREGSEYFLVTPVEKCRIDVEVAPLLVTRMDLESVQETPTVVFSTRTGDCFVLDDTHPLRFVLTDSGQIPVVMVRSELEGILSRPVFYQLAGLMETQSLDGMERTGIRSGGTFHEITGPEDFSP